MYFCRIFVSDEISLNFLLCVHIIYFIIYSGDVTAVDWEHMKRFIENKKYDVLWISSLFIGYIITLLYGIVSLNDSVSRFMTLTKWYSTLLSFFVISVLLINYIDVIVTHNDRGWFLYGWSLNTVALFSWMGLLIFHLHDGSVCSNFDCHSLFTTMFLFCSTFFTLHIEKHRFLVAAWFGACVVLGITWAILLNNSLRHAYIAEYLIFMIYSLFWVYYILHKVLSSPWLFTTCARTKKVLHGCIVFVYGNRRTRQLTSAAESPYCCCSSTFDTILW